LLHGDQDTAARAGVVLEDDPVPDPGPVVVQRVSCACALGFYSGEGGTELLIELGSVLFQCVLALSGNGLQTQPVSDAAVRTAGQLAGWWLRAVSLGGIWQHRITARFPAVGPVACGGPVLGCCRPVGPGLVSLGQVAAARAGAQVAWAVVAGGCG
jgi:hypothetical protein